jgi:hypothetical protein
MITGHSSTCQHLQAYRKPIFLLLSFVLCIVSQTFGRLTPEELSSISATGLTPLTGEQEGDYACRDYVIVETMRISHNQTVTFAAGTRLFFHPDARIAINGSLVCNGTSSKPVSIGKLQFSLPMLSTSRKMLFDSTSIYIYRKGTLSLRHTHLIDSSVRIRLTDSTSLFTFDSVTGAGNRLTLPDTALFLPDKAVVACSNEKAGGLELCIPLPSQHSPSVSLPRSPSNIKRNVFFRIGLGSAILASSGLWVYYNENAKNAGNAYTNNSPDYLRLFNKNHRYIHYRDLAAVAGGCSLLATSVTFVIGGASK